jgi:hypothetical protein
LLPEHAARAVAQSLVWWKEAVAAAAAGTKLSASSMPGNLASGQASHRPQWKRASHPVDPPSLESLAAAASRQGALWRGILDGDKRCTDLLSPQDYLRAGERLARHNAKLVGRVLRTMPLLLLPLLLALIAVVVVLLNIPGSAIARTATGIAAFAGTLSAAWRALRARVVPIAMQLEEPLWGGELDTATAQAVTVPPVGTPLDPVLESASEHEATATEVTTTATQPQHVLAAGS